LDAFPGTSLISGLQRDALIQAKTLKVKVSAFCLNNSVLTVGVLSVPVSILQSIAVLLKCLKFLKTSLFSGTVMNDFSSGTTGVLIPHRIAFIKLCKNVEGLSCRSVFVSLSLVLEIDYKD